MSKLTKTQERDTPIGPSPQERDTPIGPSSEYIATENETLLPFNKSKEVSLGPNADQDEQNRQDAVRKLLESSMYQLLLYDRAPNETLLIPDQENSDLLYLQSKHFTNEERLGPLFYEDPEQLKQLEGFEKVNAASDLLRDPFCRPYDLGVQDGSTITKIETGRSFTAQYTDFASMVKEKHKEFVGSEYTQAIKDGHLSFSAEKYSQAINQMVEQYDEQQMGAVIDQKFDELKKAGFDPHGTAVFPIGKPRKYVNSFDELKQFNKDQMKENITIMRDIAKSTEVISKFSSVPDQYKNGDWLKAFADSEIKDPVAYAAHNSIQIEGQNALEWAYNNNYQIKIPAEEQQGHDNKLPAKGLDPIEYLSTKVRKGLKLSNSEAEFLVRATEFNLPDSSRRSLKFISDSYGFSPTHKDDEIAAWVNTIDLANLTAVEVSRDYSDLLGSFARLGYLTQQEVANIKESKNYTKQVEETVELLKSETSKLGINGTDKMYYKVACFTRDIGLSNEIINYFMQKVSPEKLDKIRAIEKAVSFKIKTNAASHKSTTPLRAERLAKVRSGIVERGGSTGR